MYLDEVAAGASADGSASRGIGEVCVCKGKVDMVQELWIRVLKQRDAPFGVC